MANITPEMARAELERRRQAQNTSANITPEMARAELARRRAMQPTQTPEETGFSGVAGDFMLGIPDAAGSIYDALINTPNALYQGGKHVLMHPLQAYDDIGWGLARTIEGATNIPRNIGEYADRKQIPWLRELKNVPGIPRGMIQGLEADFDPVKSEGQEVIRGTSSFAPYIGLGGLGGLGAKTGAGALYSVAQNENPLIGAGLMLAPDAAKKVASVPRGIKSIYDTGKGAVKDWRDLPNWEQQLSEAVAKDDVMAKQVEALKRQLGTEFKETTLEGFRKSKLAREQRIKELEPLASQPRDNLENLLPGGTGEGLLKKADEIERIGGDLESRAIQALQAKLNPNAYHDVPLSKRVEQLQDAEKRDIQKNYYNKFDELIKDKYYVEPQEPNVKQIEADLRKSLSKEFWDTPVFDQLKNKIIETEQKNLGNNLIPAKDIVDNYKSLRDARNQARLKSRQEGIQAGERQKWELEAKDLDKIIEKLETVIDETIPKKDLAVFKEGNKLWRDKVGALYKNPTFAKMRFEGKLNTSDLIKELRSDKRGYPRLREVIENDPIALQHLISHDFAKSPDKLTNLNDAQSKILEKIPDVKALVDALKNARSKSATMQEQSNLLRQKAADTQAEAKKVNETFKDRQAKEKARAKAEAEIIKLSNEYKKLELAQRELEFVLVQKSMSEQQRKRVESEVERLQQRKDNITKRASKLGKIGMGAIGLGQLSKILSSLVG